MLLLNSLMNYYYFSLKVSRWLLLLAYNKSQILSNFSLLAPLSESETASSFLSHATRQHQPTFWAKATFFAVLFDRSSI